MFACFKGCLSAADAFETVPVTYLDGSYRVVGVSQEHLHLENVRSTVLRVRIAGYRQRYREDTESLDELVLALRSRDAIAKWLLPDAFPNVGEAYTEEQISRALARTPIAVLTQWVNTTEPLKARFIGANGVYLDDALKLAGHSR